MPDASQVELFFVTERGSYKQSYIAHTLICLLSSKCKFYFGLVAFPSPTCPFPSFSLGSVSRCGGPFPFRLPTANRRASQAILSSMVFEIYRVNIMGNDCSGDHGKDCKVGVSPVDFKDKLFVVAGFDEVFKGYVLIVVI